MYRHLVLISIDTLRSDCIGANPQRLWPDEHHIDRSLATPTLDRLVGNGAFFPNCITAAPYTSAAHAAILTGLSPFHNGVFEVFNRPLQAKTVMTRAKSAGYRTLFKVDFPVTMGPFLGFDRDVDDYIIEDDTRYLSALDAKVPSVSLVHFGGVHIPYGFHNLKIGGSRYRDKVKQLEAELDELVELPRDQLVETFREPEDLELLLRYKRVVEYHFNRGHYDLLFDLYLEGVEYFAATRLASFLRRLDERLPAEDRLTVVFGDHGEEYSDESYGHFNTMAEGVLRVPLIFCGPDVVAGRHPGRVRSTDILPTVLERFPDLQDTTVPLDGESLAASVWGGVHHDDDRPAISQCWIPVDTGEYTRSQQAYLRTNARGAPIPHLLYKEASYGGDLKLVRQHARFMGQEGFAELRPCDPTEVLLQLDQAGHTTPIEDAERQTRLVAALDAYDLERPTGDADRTVPAELREHLKQMGYRI